MRVFAFDFAALANAPPEDQLEPEQGPAAGGWAMLPGSPPASPAAPPSLVVAVLAANNLWKSLLQVDLRGEKREKLSNPGALAAALHEPSILGIVRLRNRLAFRGCSRVALTA